MKRAATRDKAKSTHVLKIIELLLRFKTPRATPRARQRSENRTLGATKMCESPGVTRGDGQAWN